MSKKKWELKMNEQRKLRKDGLLLLHQRVVLLTECYVDDAFLAWCQDSDTPAEEFLDAELADTACDFLTLKAVLHHFPGEVEWRDGNIREMIAEICASGKKEKEHGSRTSWKERCLVAERRIAALEKENEKLRDEIDVLRDLVIRSKAA